MTASPSGRKHTAAANNPPPAALHLHFNPLSVPVIIAIASTPARLPHLLPTLQSLKQQSYPIHRILVCLPPAPASAPPLPERLTRDPLLVLVRSAVDHGSIGRLVEAGKWLEDKGECWVVSCEEGVVYHRDTVAELVRHGVEMDGCVLGTAGYRLLGEPYVMSNVAYVRRWDERLMERWDDEREVEEERAEQELLHAPEHEQQPSKAKAVSGRSKPRSASQTTRSASSRSHAASDTQLSAHHSNGHSTPSPNALHQHASLHASHSPSASPQSPLVYPVEPCDVLSSFRAMLFPPATLPQPAVLLSHLESLPVASVRLCDDELLCGVLSLLGVGRLCLLSPLPVVQWLVDGKRGRGGGGVVEWMAWSECVEAMVRRGWWPGWEVDEREGTADGEGQTPDDALDVEGLIEEEEEGAGTAGEVVDGQSGVSGVGGGKEKEERKDLVTGSLQSVQRAKAVMGGSGH